MNEETFSKKDAELHSMLRHDLKNKLQVSLGYLQLLNDMDLTEQQNLFVKKALMSLKESTQLISKVRDIRSIWDQEGYEVDINKILEEVVSEYQHLASEEDIEIEVEGTDGTVIGSELFKNLFSNLIDNSIKHSDCSVIKIEINEDEETVVVSVEDDGKGIPEGIEENLFDFGVKKGDNAGTGLGLSYVKEIVEMYDGSIEVKESESGGARFDIEFVKA
ncbi:MAG: HAMP domain-containing sensor histidine kinase [Candidatus Saliniplasma sp.]